MTIQAARTVARRFLLVQFAALAFAAAMLVAQWASAATFLETCSRRPLANGRIGETVQTCELVRLPAPVVRSKAHAARRAGVTRIVARLGVRAPVRVASL